MPLAIGDVLFDFALSLRLLQPELGSEADPAAALSLLPSNSGLAADQVGTWPRSARDGLLLLIEIWLHVDAIAHTMDLPLTYPAALTDRSRPSKLGRGVVAWLRAAGPSLATMAGEVDALREGRRRLTGLQEATTWNDVVTPFRRVGSAEPAVGPRSRHG